MEQIILGNIWIVGLIIAWTLPWKGYALWKSAQNGHKWWFIAILVINTFAILDILYIFVFAGRGEECTND